MSVISIASRYAKSLLELAIEGGKVETILQDMKVFNDAVSNRDLYLMVKSPIIKADKKQSIFKAIFDGKIDELTSAFFDIVIRKGREKYLPEMAQQFVVQYKAHKGITSATVITAAAIDDAQMQQLKDQLAVLGASGEVDLTTKIDPSIIGGFILEIGDKLYDASVMSKLAGMKKQILDNSYIKSL